MCDGVGTHICEDVLDTANELGMAIVWLCQLPAKGEHAISKLPARAALKPYDVVAWHPLLCQGADKVKGESARGLINRKTPVISDEDKKLVNISEIYFYTAYVSKNNSFPASLDATFLHPRNLLSDT